MEQTGVVFWLWVRVEKVMALGRVWEYEMSKMRYDRMN
jgi:hypothetical protein